MKNTSEDARDSRSVTFTSMSTRYKTEAGKLYFVTLTIVGWIDVFTRKEHVELIYDNLRYCQKNKGLEIYAYVIMSNHIHLVCRTMDKPLNEVLRDFKSFTAKRLFEQIEHNPMESRKEWMAYMFRYFGKGNSQNKEIQFWVHGTHAIELHSPKVILQKVNYIHLNPVRAEIVVEPEHYLHGSAHPDRRLEVLSIY